MLSNAVEMLTKDTLSSKESYIPIPISTPTFYSQAAVDSQDSIKSDSSDSSDDSDEDGGGKKSFGFSVDAVKAMNEQEGASDLPQLKRQKSPPPPTPVAAAVPVAAIRADQNRPSPSPSPESITSTASGRYKADTQHVPIGAGLDEYLHNPSILHKSEVVALREALFQVLTLLQVSLSLNLIDTDGVLCNVEHVLDSSGVPL